MDVPYGVYLVILGIESADVSPQLLLHIHHILQLFHHRRTEIQGEVGAVIVASGMPTFDLFVLVCFLAFFERVDGYGAEIEKGAAAG